MTFSISHRNDINYRNKNHDILKIVLTESKEKHTRRIILKVNTYFPKIILIMLC